jgi:hypothetical protein
VNILATVILLTAACGIMVVAGGIYLLSKGAITLAATAPADALTIEWQKKFRVNTQVPGIAFFVLGLGFVMAALFWASPSPGHAVDLRGEIGGVDGPVTLIIRTQPLPLPVFSDGIIRYRFYPDFSVLTLEASAPGYEPMPVPVEIARAGVIDVGKLNLKRKIDEIRAQPDSITAIGFRPPPVTQTAGTFGLSK